MSSDNKKTFDWEEGAVLDDKNSKPLGGVRVKGMQKIEQSPLADPKERALARKEVLSQAQSQNYKEHIQARRSQEHAEETSLIIEESHSGVNEDFEPSEAKKIFDSDADKEHQFQGIGRRFGGPNPNSKK